MSWSLRLQHGDLAIGTGSYGQVTGAVKLVQDLRCFILERMGTDDAHPAFGSLFDGGVKSDGTIVQSVIGERQTDLVILEVEQDLNRIIADYQSIQLARAKQDRMTYGKASISRGEALVAANVNLTPNFDALDIIITVVTGDGSTFDLSLPLPGALTTST